MAATVESLTVAIDDQASAASDQMAASMQGAADAADKLAGSVETTDATITRSTRSWQSWAASGVDPAATSAKKAEAAQRAAQAATDALTDALQKGQISAAQFAQGQQDIAAALSQRTAAAQNAQAKTEALRSSTNSLTTDTSAAEAAIRQLGQSQANAFANVTDPTDYKSRSADILAYGASMDALRAKYNPLFAASKQYESTLNEIAGAEKVGAISAAEASAARDRVTASFAQAQAPLKATSAAMKDVATTSDAASGHMGGFSGATAGATRELIVLGHEAISGNWNRIPGSLIVMAERAGSLHDIIGSVTSFATSMGGAFVIGGAVVVGALVAAGVAANDNAAKLGDLRESLRLTHDDYASLADAVDASAKRVSSSSTLTKSAAEDLGKAIASSRYLGGFSQDLDALTKSAANLARVMGGDSVAAGKQFRQSIDDPAAAVKALAEQGLPEFNKILASTGDTVLRTVQNLANSGQYVQATQLIFDTLGRSTKGATDDMTPLGKALHDLEQRFYGARDGGKSFADVLGTMVNSFAALEVHGLDVFIQGLEQFATKAGAATQKVIELQGATDDLGRTIPNSASKSPAVSLSGPSSASLAQVDPSIQALLQDSAKQYQVDSELLSRLQLAENRTPSGHDAAGNAIYPSSPTGAVGPMQVTGTTFRGMPEFAGQNIADNATNIDAGTSLFATLLKKYGDPYMAVLAYHDGETLIDKVLSGALDSSGNSYQASIAGKEEAVKVTQGYTGRGYLGVGGTSPSPNDVGGFIPGKSSASVVLPDSVQRALGTGGDGTQFANAQDAAASVEKYTRAIIDMHAAGEDSGPTMDRLQALLSKAREAAYGAVSPFDSLTRASKDQLAPLTAQSGAARTVAEAVNAATIALRSHGEDITSAQADQVRTDALTKLSLAFNDNVAGINRQIEAQNAINQVYAQSGGNIAEITAKTQAEASARQTAIPGTAEYARQVAILTEKNLGLANSQKDLAQIQQNKGLTDNIAYIQKETDTLGLNEDARTRVLAVMKAEQEQHAKYGPILTDEEQHYIDLIGKQADYTASLKNQQASLSELTGFFDNTFSTISDAIVSAFATGSQSAVKFQDVVGSVVKAIEAEFIKLALVNPLKDLFLGTTSPSLSSVGGILGKLLGNDGGTTIVGSAGITGAAGLVSAFDGAGTTASGSGSSISDPISLGTVATGAKLVDQVLGGGSGSSTGGGLLAGLADKITNAVTSALGNASSATNIALSGAGEGVYGVASTSEVAAASIANSLGVSDSLASTISSAASTVVSALPYIGTAITLVTDIANGNYRGAGLVATGAIVGSFFGPVGTAVGAAVGGLIDAFLPSHPLHPYSNVDLNIQGGKLTTDNGYDVGQLTNLSSDKAGVQAYADSINTYLQKVGVVITDADGTLGHIGAGITGFNRAGLTTGQTTDPASLFKNLSFGDDPNDTSNFGVAKGALTGMSFNSPIDLQTELYKIAGFADAVDALGINLASVGKDISNIQIASVTGANPGGTSTVTNASGEQVTFLSDLRTALNADLPGKTFADTSALDAEMQKVSDFVTGTLPSLLTPVRATQSTLQDQIQASNQKYADAAAQSRSYGLNNDAALAQGRDEAITILMKPATDALNTLYSSIAGRGQTLLSGQYSTAAGQATLSNLAQTQNNERSSLYDTIHQTYGDNQNATDAYNNALQALLVTQNAETQATLLQATTTRDQSISTLASLQASYAQRAGLNDEAAALAAQDAKAAVERDQFYAAWIDTYGQLSTATQAFQDQLVIVDAAHAADRLAIEQNYATQSNAALKQAQGSVTTLFGSIKDYALKLQTGSQSTLSPLSQYDVAKSQFNAVSGAAAAGDATSAQQLTTYADALLSASQAVNGSGANYANDYSQVLDALQSVTASSDTLTQSFITLNTQTQTDTLATAIAGVQNEVAALRREMAQQTRAMAIAS